MKLFADRYCRPDKTMQIFIQTEFYIVLVTACFLIDLRWVLAWFTAAFLHEIFHYLALRLRNQQIFSLQIGALGAKMETMPLSAANELICALAGPLGGVLCLLFSDIFPRLAVCGFIQSTFNLLPVYPMDGGRVVKSLCQIFFPAICRKLCNGIQQTVYILLLLFGIYASFVLRLGCLPVAIPAVMMLKGKIKIPCKLHREQVE